MKKLIKSRRGVAIELAIGVMFLMIAFTIMLLSTAGLQNDHRVDDYRDFKEKIEVDNIGEYVIGNQEKYKTETNIIIDEIDTGYDVMYSDSTYKIYKGEDVVLTIEMDGNKIISWK